jgi:hypothetical protein
LEKWVVQSGRRGGRGRGRGARGGWRSGTGWRSIFFFLFHLQMQLRRFFGNGFKVRHRVPPRPVFSTISSPHPTAPLFDAATAFSLSNASNVLCRGARGRAGRGRGGRGGGISTPRNFGMPQHFRQGGRHVNVHRVPLFHGRRRRQALLGPYPHQHAPQFIPQHRVPTQREGRTAPH